MGDVVPLAAGSAALHLVLRSLGDGAQALHRLAPGEPAAILWREHFDVGISAGRVNYGVSPGDTGHDLPYAYVGPRTAAEGAFWNEPFGASRDTGGLDGVDGVLEFFRTGRSLATPAESGPAGP